MPQIDPPKQSAPRDMRDAYVQLGLEPGATMREVESAYWRFAGALRGQAALAPYTEAYEALVAAVTPPPKDTPSAPAAPAEALPENVTPLRPSPGSKFGWPAQ